MEAAATVSTTTQMPKFENSLQPVLGPSVGAQSLRQRLRHLGVLVLVELEEELHRAVGEVDLPDQEDEDEEGNGLRQALASAPRPARGIQP